jgi:hypothetical protein
MNTIQQTVHIPADRRLRLDLILPEDIPEGQVEMRIHFSPVPESSTYESIKHFSGCLADSKTFSGDSVELQRAIRDEW